MEAVRGKHSISLIDRSSMHIEGVSDVQSFDEHSVVLCTVCGDMAIEGKDLKIAVLEIDAGIVVLSGTVSGVYYYEQTEQKKRGFFGKLLK